MDNLHSHLFIILLYDRNQTRVVEIHIFFVLIINYKYNKLLEKLSDLII